MPIQSLHSLPGQQRGAALITGLLIMIIMTLIGIATMESSIIQTNLAGNSQLNAIGFQTTEATLRRVRIPIPANAGLRNQTLNAVLINNNPGFNATIDYPQQNITLDNTSTLGGIVAVNTSAQVNFCGELLPNQSSGTGQNATQNALNTTPTEYAYTYTARTNVGGQATTQHVQQIRFPQPSLKGQPGSGNVALCLI